MYFTTSTLHVERETPAPGGLAISVVGLLFIGQAESVVAVSAGFASGLDPVRPEPARAFTTGMHTVAMLSAVLLLAVAVVTVVLLRHVPTHENAPEQVTV
ncbi:hypothetical protein AB0B45_25600 [Nonomuraea sp. NPDC049152]|uniref:hypothetical protein n=1 Tax=Nonomuraea sp. NPDC049152 TaxID=3154350 RepID=UPI0033DC4A3B